MAQASAATDQLHYAAHDQLVVPKNYRSWIFLTSSLDLNYDEPVPGAATSRSLLDNVFVNPSAYAQFVKTGRWPDGTVLIKENRLAASAGTLSRSGKFQTQIVSMELHVKDQKRFPGQWAFFVTDGKAPARYVAPGAACYSCHADHGAVESTFVQFYPTLLQIASDKGTLESRFLKERAALAGKD
ncbi:MAG TPA: cytochrome P460 family protein [Steroidobacteraceae bacterium]|jgi:hypothetical protein|nr:cytochrome P460 family protein [Steroidobacteraceae bacterium]